jgi:hypothetical protein
LFEEDLKAACGAARRQAARVCKLLYPDTSVSKEDLQQDGKCWRLQLDVTGLAPGRADAVSELLSTAFGKCWQLKGELQRRGCTYIVPQPHSVPSISRKFGFNAECWYHEAIN